MDHSRRLTQIITINASNKQSPYNFIFVDLCPKLSFSFDEDQPFPIFLVGLKPLTSNSLISFLKSCRKRGFFMLCSKLLFAYWRLVMLELLIWPTPCSSLVMKEIVAITIVRTFQEEVHVYLWKLVKVVQMGLSTQNLPLGVKNINFGGAKGYSSLSSSTP